MQNKPKIVTGSQVAYTDEAGNVSCEYVTLVKTMPTYNLEGILFSTTQMISTEKDGLCYLASEVIPLDAEKFSFFYPEFPDSGRITVAYRVVPSGVYYRKTVCSPKDRFTKQAGRFWAMNSTKQHFIPSLDLTDGVIKDGVNFDCTLLSTSHVLRCIEDKLYLEYLFRE